MLRALSTPIASALSGAAPAVGAGLLRHARVAARTFASAASDEEIEVEIPKPYEAYMIDAPPQKVKTSMKELVGVYESMYRMRRMEVAADLLYKAKMIRGFCHLYDGQEAIAGGIQVGTTFQDSIVTSYRDHCIHLIRGGTVTEVIGELMGKRCGATMGFGGSMHMYSAKNNYYGGHGIVGAQIPVGTGLGFKHLYEGERNVALTLYGDGAANQGQHFEALNMAAIWNLPVLYIIENNHYGMGTSDRRASKQPEFYKRGGYIPGIKVDGMDAMAVKNAIMYAKEYAVENGPIMLEMDTYRYHGHSMSDPGSTYRTRDEIQSTRQERDPVDRVKAMLTSNGFEAAAVKKIEKAIKKEVDDAIEDAKKGDYPPLDWIGRYTYVDPLGRLTRGVDRFSWWETAKPGQ
ncbi:unnamed protein product [Pedinophyceae sp. YPF-701]|nr:unnamed protein product [Pedinophyceae sp. YPF-701]